MELCFYVSHTLFFEINFLYFYSPFSLADFVKFFRSGDHKFHQEQKIKYSRVDAPNTHVGQETSEMIVEGKNYSDSAFSINIMCPGNIELNTNIV